MNLQQRSIRRQLLVFVTLTILVVLVSVGATLFTSHVRQFRAKFSQSFQSTAGIIANNAAASVAFRDPVAAQEILDSLANDRSILSAGLYLKDGYALARYKDAPEASFGLPPGDGFETLSLEVSYKGEVFGQLYLRSRLPLDLRKTVEVWIAVYLAAFGFAGLLAFMLAARFQRAIADPLLELAQQSRRVTEKGDYDTRAEVEGPAEIRELAYAFNTMLAEIGRRDQDIARKNTELGLQLGRLRAEMTERQRVEEQLRESSQELMRLSREAGMAEVATGVLHNIGNVLNSVNVSAELLGELVRIHDQHPARTLEQLIATPTPEVEAIFAAHPRGPELAAVLHSLINLEIKQIEDAAREVSSLRTMISHLKDVVSRQQTLAKSKVVLEKTNLSELVDEALLLDGGSTVSFDVERTEVGEVSLRTDRSYVVQILLNLVRNARSAMMVAPQVGAKLRLTYGSKEEGRRFVAVQDDGCGIPPEQLQRVFAYGYTTKKEGHGFGLHNSANAARLLGGSLQVSSEGAGRGATFTLELPADLQAKP